jgi:hypothetical protein
MLYAERRVEATNAERVPHVFDRTPTGALENQFVALQNQFLALSRCKHFE